VFLCVSPAWKHWNSTFAYTAHFWFRYSSNRQWLCRWTSLADWFLLCDTRTKILSTYCSYFSTYSPPKLRHLYRQQLFVCLCKSTSCELSRVLYRETLKYCARSLRKKQRNADTRCSNSSWKCTTCTTVLLDVRRICIFLIQVFLLRKAAIK
jgi:hypothetical protein